jgi:hypothetical protein
MPYSAGTNSYIAEDKRTHDTFNASSVKHCQQNKGLEDVYIKVDNDTTASWRSCSFIYDARVWCSERQKIPR